MDDSTRVKRVLRYALPEDTTSLDPYEDLDRAHCAQRARSRRRLRVGLGALVLTMIAGVGVAGVLGRAVGPEDAAPSTNADPIQLVAKEFHANPYVFDLTPKGWSVQAQSPYAVTIAPDDGSTSADPNVFVGKLVISFDHNPPPGHRLVGSDPRVWIHEDSGYTTMSMRTAAGQPAGVVHIQYPDKAGWSTTTMVRFLRSVHVGAGARAAAG